MDSNSPQWQNTLAYPGSSLPTPFPSNTSGSRSASGPSENSPDSNSLFGGQPLAVGQPPLFASDDSWAYGSYDLGDDNDQGDAKRRRIARACDSCRRKKIKCDAKMPKCTHCENYKIECVFTHVEKKRAPPKGAKYIEGLENRLGRMEHLLRLSGLLTEEDDEGADLGTLEQRLAQQVNSNRESPRSSMANALGQARPESRQGDSKRSEQPASGTQTPAGAVNSPKIQHGEQKVSGEEVKKDSEVDDLADMMWCSLVTNNQGETRFIGSSSGFSIFSPKGIQWVSEKTGDKSFPNMINVLSQDDNKWHPWREEVFDDIFARRVFKPLPPREECQSLMEEFFESFNRMFPLFHEPTFMHLIDMQYSDDPYDGSGWWACLNVALAIAYRIRILKNILPQTYEEYSYAYFKNALAVLSELTMRNTDLLSVQALIGMALFLQGSPNPQPTFYLIGAAIRLAHSIGLHKHGDGFGLNKVEIEQRKRVFWIAYLIDKDVCLRSGRPPAQDDDDWNVELPSEDPEDGVGTVPLADGSKTNLFHALCRFGVISAKVYNKLYSVRAARQSDGELLTTIGELDTELEEWKDSIPLDFRPAHELTALPPELVVHIVMLHFAYYNCLTTIHRRSVHHGYWTSRLSNYAVSGLNVKPLNPRVFSSAALCVSAARMSIHLIKYIPPGDYACIWLIIYYPVSALVTLFANILQNPQDVHARPDLKLINLVVQFLQNTSYEDTTGSMQRICDLSREFERIATVVLQKAEDGMTGRQKRKQEKEREKLAKQPQDPVEIPQPTRNSQDSRRPDLQQLYESQQRQLETDGSTNGNSGGVSGRQIHPLKQERPVAQQNVFNPLSMLNSDFSRGANSANRNTPNSTSTFGVFPGSPNFPNFQPYNQGQGQGQSQSQSQSQDQRNLQPPFSPNDFLTSPLEASSPDYARIFSDSRAIPNAEGGFSSQSSFQQPMVPQELWNMPMTFEWDFSDAFNPSMGMMGALGLNGGAGAFDPFGPAQGSGGDGTTGGSGGGGGGGTGRRVGD